MPHTLKLGYSIDEAAQIVPFSRATIYRLMREGKLRFTQVNGRRVIPHSALLELVGESEEAAA